MFGRKKRREAAARGGAQSVADDILSLARTMDASGNADGSLHLYLAAFDAAEHEGHIEPAFVEGLRRAWRLAADEEDHALAEHIFEKLAPYADEDDRAAHGRMIEGIARQALAGIGLPDEAAVQIAHDLADAPAGGAIVHVDRDGVSVARQADAHREEPHDHALSDASSYEALVGFDAAITSMRERGIGLHGDRSFDSLLEMLRKRHGIDGSPAADTMLFRAPSRDDANDFMLATLAEMRLPCARLRMDDGPAGQPVLGVMLSPHFRNVQQFAHNGFDGEGVLVLEDVDLWTLPPFGHQSEGGPMFMMFSHAAGEVMGFIGGAVQDPQVTIMASCEDETAIPPALRELVEPFDYIDIADPTADERAAVWRYLGMMHPSLQALDRDELVRYSEGLSRADICYAAREAVEQAFKQGVAKRRFVPVTRDNVLEKLASCLPFDSEAYQRIEDQIVLSLRTELDASPGAGEQLL